MIGRAPSSVCLTVDCFPHSLHIFSSETTEPLEAKFHMESSWNGRTKVWFNGAGHMTKMAAKPLSGKYLKQILLRNQKVDDLETWFAGLGARILSSLFK